MLLAAAGQPQQLLGGDAAAVSSVLAAMSSAVMECRAESVCQLTYDDCRAAAPDFFRQVHQDLDQQKHTMAKNAAVLVAYLEAEFEHAVKVLEARLNLARDFVGEVTARCTAEIDDTLEAVQPTAKSFAKAEAADAQADAQAARRGGCAH